MNKRTRSKTDLGNDFRDNKYRKTEKTLERVLDQDEGTKDESGSLAVNSDTPNHKELYERGLSHDERFRRLGELEDIQKAIEYIERALVLTPDSHPDLSLRLAGLGMAYGHQFQRLGKLEDLKISIEHRIRALEITPKDHPSLSERLAGLGVAYTQRFQRLGELDDLEKSIEYRSRSLIVTPKDHPDYSSRLTGLGVTYTHRFRRLDELTDLDKAIDHYSRALALTPEGHPHHSRSLANLGLSYTDRFRRIGEVEDLDRSIEYNSRALGLVPDGHPHKSHRLASLGVAYSDRFQRLNQLADLEKSIQYHSRALELTPDNHPDKPRWLADLGVCYADRFKRLGELGDLDKSIECKSTAFALTPEGHSEIRGRLADLGGAYGIRFQRLGELEDVEKSINYYSRTIALTPDGHPDKPCELANLGTAHTCRFRRLGKIEDLERAIEYDSRALALAPNDHPDIPRYLVSLAVSHSDRFKRSDAVEDIQKSIDYCSRALALTPDDHPDLAHRHANLGLAYDFRFQRLGDLEDLEKSINNNSRALSLTPPDHPKLPQRHSHLAASYTSRFRHLGELEDLHKSIEHSTYALRLTPEGHPELSLRLANLGLIYTQRLQRLGELTDLEKSIEYISRALELTPNDHPDLSSRLAGLGVCYTERFRRLGERDDLEKSIEYYSRALLLAPGDHPEMLIRHGNLGLAYSDRFERLGKFEDLKKAIEHRDRALALTPDDHPIMPRLHFNQALSYFLQHQHTRSLSPLIKSLDHFRTASRYPTGAPRVKFQYAFHWAKLASMHSPLNCIEAFQVTMELLPQFIWLGATASQRYKDLSIAEDLALRAASAAISYSDYKLALEWLEHARCVVWKQSLVLRSPLDQIRIFHPDLASRLQTIADQLYSASSESPASRELSTAIMTPEHAAQQHRRLAKEYNDILTHIRKLPGFDSFLKPTKADSLIQVADYGPVIIISCSEGRCDALVIMPRDTQVHSLPLPSFSQKKAHHARVEMQKSLKSQGIRERGAQVDQLEDPEDQDGLQTILKLLWDAIVKPVLDFLGYTSNPATGDLPHITWCPTGAVSFLPLHAAGDYDRPRSRVFDYAISSYTPTLTALLSSSPSSLSPGSRVLGVGQESTHTPGYKLSKLPGTTKELNLMKQHTQNMAHVGFSELTGNKATKSAVLDAMEQHDWVHLACHAHQNVGDATESGFFLHDGILDLASINRRSFKNKGLAFLSACQTATGDSKLPDEAVHLASGMLIAGYASVIATMWSVVDEDAPFVADKVYAQLLAGGRLGNGQAGKALHNAVAGLREKVGEQEFGRWVPYIHVGS